MPISPTVLREYAALNRKRKGSGITPFEFQRWLDLTMQLEKAFPGKPAPGSSGTTRLQVEFVDERALEDAIMVEVEPTGLFVCTPFAAEPGTRFELRVTVESTGEKFKSRMIVISNNLGPGYSTRALGMGLRFARPRCPLRAKLDELCGVDSASAPDPEDSGVDADDGVEIELTDTVE